MSKEINNFKEIAKELKEIKCFDLTFIEGLKHLFPGANITNKDKNNCYSIFVPI